MPGTVPRGCLKHLLQVTFAPQGPQGVSRFTLFTCTESVGHWRWSGGVSAAYFAFQKLCLEGGLILVPEASPTHHGETGVSSVGMSFAQLSLRSAAPWPENIPRHLNSRIPWYVNVCVCCRGGGCQVGPSVLTDNRARGRPSRGLPCLLGLFPPVCGSLIIILGPDRGSCGGGKLTGSDR